MLYMIHLILLAVTVANAVPSPPLHMDHDILENTIDNDSSANDEDFSKELPYESEYYRTSTDRDEFVRPHPGPEENEIDDGEGGIDLDDTFASDDTPECTYHIFIQQYFESIDRLDIKLDGLQVKSTSKSDLTPEEFTSDAQAKIFENIKGKTLTNELVNDVIEDLRHRFTETYGYADFCGVSTNVITYFMKNESHDDSHHENESHDSNHHESYDGITEMPCDTDSSTQIEADSEPDHVSTTDVKTTTAAATTGTATTETPTATTGTVTTGTMTATTEGLTTGTMTTVTGAETTGTEVQTELSAGTDTQTELSTVDVTNTDEMDLEITTTTEKYVPRVLKRPKISAVVRDSINFYKALHNWKYSA